LRGFSAFDYLGSASAAAQVEVRWRFLDRWGLVAFGGSGWAGSSYSADGDDETIKSFGTGLRFDVLPAKRVNVRLDFARSEGSDGVYFSVGEAF
jgi:hemolysin activation/secretion protein